MFTLLYYGIPICIVALCLYLIFVLTAKLEDHLASLRFTLPLSVMLFGIGFTISVWTPLSPLPYYQAHLHVQKVQQQSKTAETYLEGLVDKGLLDTTVKKHVTHQHFSVAQKKISQIDDPRKRKALMDKHNDYLSTYEHQIGDRLIQKLQLEHLSISEYSNLTAHDYDNVRYQIQQQIQTPRTEQFFLERVEKLQKRHDLEYQSVTP